MRKSMKTLFVAALVLGVTGCASVQQIKYHENSSNLDKSRKFVVLIDGTMNDANDTTNVSRLHSMLINQDADDIVTYYASGVGTDWRGGVGAATGWGMKDDIQNTYLALATCYNPRDALYFFGFSRGAFASRALLGMIEKVGLVQFPRNCAKKERPYEQRQVVRELYALYTIVSHLPEQDRKKRVEAYRAENPQLAFNDAIRPRVLGFWDTVESMGARAKFGNLDDFHPYHADGSCLADKVLHAVALDENRHEYVPKLYDERSHGACKDRIKQVWFPGAHSDVGGGYDDSKELPGLSLNWMLSEIKDEKLIPENLRVYENCFSAIHDAEGDNPLFRAVFDREFRHGLLQRNASLTLGNQLHASVLIRMANDSGYMPAPLVKDAGSCFTPNGKGRILAGKNCYHPVGNQAKCDGKTLQTTLGEAPVRQSQKTNTEIAVK